MAAGLLARNAGRQGPDRQALGQDLAGARLARSSPNTSPRPACRRISTSSASTWSASAAPPASAIPARCRRRSRRRSMIKGLIAAAVHLRQPQLRGPRLARCAGQLPRLAAAGRRLCAGRFGPDGPDDRAARHRLTTASRSSSRTSGPPTRRSRTSSRKNVTARACSRRKYADVFKGDAHWQTVKAPEGQTYAWDDASTYVQNPPYFAGHQQDADAGHRHQGRPHPRPLRRQDHHRPHLAGRFDQGRLARRRLSHRAWRRRGRLQPVRHAPRQS